MAYIKVLTWDVLGRTEENNKKALTCLMTEQVDPVVTDKPVGWELSQGCL
jgi:hypothetical protein